MQLEQDLDIILKNRDIVKAATDNWKSKWTPAILAYVKTLKSKAIKTALRVLESKLRGMYTILDNIQCMYVQLIHSVLLNCADDEEDEKNALYLIVSLMLRGDPEENLRMVYEEHQLSNGDLEYLRVISQIAHDPSVVADGGKTSAPIIASLQDVDGTNEYFIIVEKESVVWWLKIFL